MKILVDESLPRELKRRLAEHEIFTVQEMGWTGVKNGELLAKANTAFDVFLTADKNLRYQQKLSGLKFAIIVFPTNRLNIVLNLVERTRQVLADIKSGEVVEL